MIDDATGKQLGIMAPRDALQLARERNLDLVEVAPNANPPVCRIMDFGKFMYARTKKEREAKKGQKIIEVKEIRIRPKTAQYHVSFKLNRVRDWLKKGNKVKVRVLFRSREITHAQLGRDALEEIAAEMADVASVEQAPLMDGKSLVMVLAPGAHKGGPEAARRAVRSAKNLKPPTEQTTSPASEGEEEEAAENATESIGEDMNVTETTN